MIRVSLFHKRSFLTVLAVLTCTILACQVPFLANLPGHNNGGSVPGPTSGPLKTLAESTSAPTLIATPPADQPTTAATPVAQASQMSGKQVPLGVSGDDVEKFYNYVFTSAPYNLDQNGNLYKRETDKQLCLNNRCANITLFGSPTEGAANLAAVFVSVPTDPTDQKQTMTSLTMLMSLAHYFTGDDKFPYQIMNDFVDAQAKKNALDRDVKFNDFIFTEIYDANTHDGTLGVKKVVN